MRINIVTFEPKHAQAFKKLNLQWLERYFYVEEKDRLLLDACEESIIGNGGYIFLAEAEDEVVGCFALLPFGERSFELGKMAVAPAYQGYRIGQQLLSFAVEFAREKKWAAIVLYSSTKLDAALHIYRKFGFKEVALEKDCPYLRSDIKMQLTLADPPN